MAQVILKNSKECRNAYRDILQGYSHIPNGDKYIKHFAEADLGLLENIYNSYKIGALEMGLMTEKDKLAFLKEEDFWTEEEENEYRQAKSDLSDTIDHLSKIVIPEQREKFKEEVQKDEIALREISIDRDDIVNPTVESYCNKKINEDYVYRAFYKNEQLTEPYYTKEEYGELSYREIGGIVQEYNESISSYSEKNIKRIAVNTFFLNAFMMSDNDPVKFYGKAVLEMTVYQMNLYTRGKFCKSILQESELGPPDQHYRDEAEGVEHLMNWFDNEYNLINSRREQQRNQAKQQQSVGRSRRRR